MRNILSAWKESSCNRKRVVLLSSILVTRRESFPGVFLNGMRYVSNNGVLDAKAAGEEALREVAVQENFDYSIIRPGQLVGGPYANTYARSIFEVQ